MSPKVYGRGGFVFAKPMFYSQRFFAFVQIFLHIFFLCEHGFL
jgi:hypothetical protein